MRDIFIMRFFKNFFYFISFFILLFVFTIPTLILIFYNLSSIVWISEMARYLVTIIIIFLFYRFWKDRINLFVLPVCFIPVPFILFFIMMYIWHRGVVHISNVDNWGFFAHVVAVSYSLPFFILTFFISLVMEIAKFIKKKKEGDKCF